MVTYYWDSTTTPKDACKMSGGVWLSGSGVPTGNTSGAPPASLGSSPNNKSETSKGDPDKGPSKSSAQGTTSGAGRSADASRGSTGSTAGRSSSNSSGNNAGKSTDSCWDAPSNCVVVKSSRWQKDQFIIVYENICNKRVYVGKCLEQKDGKSSCGADGIYPGKTNHWDTYNATGRSFVKWLGVEDPADDWVCAGKAPHWRDPPQYK
jgi:hypothetical protein